MRLTMFPLWFPEMPFAVVFLILSVRKSTLGLTLMWVAFACLCIVVTFMRLWIAVISPWEAGAPPFRATALK